MLNAHCKSENKRQPVFHYHSREDSCSHRIPGILRGRTRQIRGRRCFTIEQWVRNSIHTVFTSYICVGAAKNRCSSSSSKNSKELSQVRFSSAIRVLIPGEQRRLQHISCLMSSSSIFKGKNECRMLLHCASAGLLR